MSKKGKTKLVESWEELCQKKGYNPETILPDVSNYPHEHQAAVIAFSKLILILEDIRKGHKFDYNNWEEWKYYPWWDLEMDANNPAGFRLPGVARDCTSSGVSSRLSLRSRAEVEHAAKHFESLYKDLIKQ